MTTALDAARLLASLLATNPSATAVIEEARDDYDAALRTVRGRMRADLAG
ncbi:hypothetical protein DFJ66_2546 [Saccharothrix variisporea]|uniref:Uncharacterized protein n=1 Tax=Saccharothrix variisporea TaxID=543527 RepID=A0A495X8Z3_9PSEU|nr:hypothetical protein DFJ66_2546 [Saccharothrix variisporea]